MAVLNPAEVWDILDFGLLGIAMGKSVAVTGAGVVGMGCASYLQHGYDGLY